MWKTLRRNVGRITGAGTLATFVETLKSISDSANSIMSRSLVDYLWTDYEIMRLERDYLGRPYKSS